MEMDDRRQTRIQILAAREETGRVGRAVAAISRCAEDFAAVAGERGAEAVLVCPAPEGLAGEGVDVVVAARFAEDLDEDAVFWRQLKLMQDIHDLLQLQAAVVDLDSPLDGFLNHIGPILAAPYRDELGSRGSTVRGG
jgi:hypothetical protein